MQSDHTAAINHRHRVDWKGASCRKNVRTNDWHTKQRRQNLASAFGVFFRLIAAWSSNATPKMAATLQQIRQKSFLEVAAVPDEPN